MPHAAAHRSARNIVLELTAGGSADVDGLLQNGDVVIGVDGMKLVDKSDKQILMKLKDKMATIPPREIHHFLIQRGAPEPEQGGFKSRMNVLQSSSMRLEDDDEARTVIVPASQPRPVDLAPKTNSSSDLGGMDDGLSASLAARHARGRGADSSVVMVSGQWSMGRSRR